MIDPKKIEEWKARLTARPGYAPVENGNGAVRCSRCLVVLMPGTEAYDWHGESPAYACEPTLAIAREAIPALLSEREELQRQRDEACKLAGFPSWKAEYLAKVERRRAEDEKFAREALSVLREVEWSRPGGADGCLYTCPSCHRPKPWTSDRGITLDGHSPDCRLAALLKP